MERGRTELLRAIGLDQGAMFAAGGDPFGFVVRRMTVDFLKPARMDDVVVVETVPKAAGGAAIILVQRVLREDVVLAEAQVKIAAVAGGRARRLPADLRARIAALTTHGTAQ